MSWEEYAERCRQLGEKARNAQTSQELNEIEAELNRLELLVKY
jgi:hypothetical protein